MINIIICDDIVDDVNKIEKIVKNHFKTLKYNIYKFNDFDKNFMKIVNLDLENKIYLLDIETPSMSGIDAARIIRKNDYSSVIIFLSGHDDLSRLVAKRNIMALNFINKYDNLKSNLTHSLDLALSFVGKKRRVRLSCKNITYNIEIDSILYITRETVSRKTIIVCDKDTYYLNVGLNRVISELSNDFVQTHRACFVNRNRIHQIDKKNMIITFDNESSINLLSKKYIERIVVDNDC